MEEKAAAEGKAEVKPVVTDKYPGKIALANERGHFPGVKALELHSVGKLGDIATQINEFFEANRGFLLVDVKYHGETALVFYTAVLEPEERQELEEIQHEVSDLIRRRKEEREKAKNAYEESQAKNAAAAAEARSKQQKELEHFADIGRKCEKRHGSKGK